MLRGRKARRVTASGRGPAHEAAVAAADEVDDPHLPAEAERALGALLLLSAAHRDEAIAHLRTAVTVLRSLGSPPADSVQAELDRAPDS